MKSARKLFSLDAPRCPLRSAPPSLANHDLHDGAAAEADAVGYGFVARAALDRDGLGVDLPGAVVGVGFSVSDRRAFGLARDRQLAARHGRHRRGGVRLLPI